jgi:hypothetical protein
MARFQLQNHANPTKAIEDAINAISDQTNADPSGARQGAPTKISAVNVVEADGFHDIQVVDNAPAYPGINYFAYYSRDQKNWHKVDMGASQNHRVYLGSGAYYWKSNHAYPTSQPSSDVYHGGAKPVAVGSGSHVGPEMQQSQGQPAFGTSNYRNASTPPIRK